MVDFRAERATPGLVAGIDEVGRGPLAGPVVAAVLIVPAKRVPRGLRGLVHDSKSLSAARRATAAAALWDAARRGEVQIALGAASARDIDRLNILQATFLAMRRALARLPFQPDHVLVDGDQVPPGLACPGRAIIGGDARVFSIAAASIVAKEVRDRAMRALARRHPAYGWERNMGYGTALHLQAIESEGSSRHHRLSFAPLSQRSLDL
jgi:ribonuclease HII